MKHLALTKEQMNYLKELGLDTSDASMFYGYKERLGLTPPDVTKISDPAYTFQDILRHLTLAHRQMVMRYEPNEWLYAAYEKLVFQLTHKEDFA